MGVLCAKRNVEVWTLEHADEWRKRVLQTLKTNGVLGVHVCAAPLVEYGEFVWYAPPLSQMPEHFSLVICDGPPGSTKGGRYGLLPVMGDRLPVGSTILLDDAGRPAEAKLMEQWKSEARLETEVIETQQSKYAVIRRAG